MKIKSIYTGMIVVLALLLSGISAEIVQGQSPPVEHELVVKKINDVWRVVHADDELKSDVTVRRGDRIRWTVEGSNASFQFSDDRLFGGGTRTIRDGNPLVLAVRGGAEFGIYTYSVFLHEDQQFAVGNSPPRIFVIAH